MAAVREGSSEWDRVDRLSAREDVPTAEDVESTFPESDVHGSPDLLLAEIDNQIVGYNHVFWHWAEVTGVRVYLHLGYLLPQWRGKGIGSCMLHWAQQRIRVIAANEQSHGETTFATNVSTTEREADTLMQHEQYTAVRRLSDMVLQPLNQSPLLPLPPETTLRLIEPGHYRAVYRAWKDAFADLWTSTVESDADYLEFKADNLDVPNFDPALCQVAWVGDAVVGFVLSRIHKGVGTIPEVAVRKAWQRRGIARSLLIHALNALHARGMTQVRLFTDADDGQGARSLYERIGFREVKQHIFYRKPFTAETGSAV
ncbi:MAG: GNAT family N-acetyltransferase [Roseiflexaceae bacterium]